MSDPFEKWRSRAHLLASEMAFDPSLVNETVGILCSSLGETWIAEQAQRRQKGTPHPFRVHPVGEALHVAGKVQVAELLELAEYLKFSSASPAFYALVAGLRSQYRTTRLQLGTGYRFHRAGARSIHFEPTAASGRLGDVSFEYKGEPCLVECYIPEIATESRTGRGEVQWLTNKIVTTLKDKPVPISVAIRLHVLPTATERKALARHALRMADEVEAQSIRPFSYPPTSYLATDTAEISVGRTFKVGPTDKSIIVTDPLFPVEGQPAILIVARWAPKAAALRIDKPDYRGEGGTHVAVWMPPEHSGFPNDLDPTVNEFIPKLKAKLAQTKREDSPRRLLVVESWLEVVWDRLTPIALRTLQHKLFEQHSNVSGLLVVGHSYSEYLARGTYRIRSLLAPGVDRQFAELITRVEHLERSHPIPSAA